MPGPVFTTSAAIAQELGISVDRVKTLVKKLGLPYAPDRRGGLLLEPNAIEHIVKGLIKPHKTSKKQLVAAKERGEARKAKAKAKAQEAA